jgi:hypothetical protein
MDWRDTKEALRVPGTWVFVLACALVAAIAEYLVLHNIG